MCNFLYRIKLRKYSLWDTHHIFLKYEVFQDIEIVPIIYQSVKVQAFIFYN